MKTRKRIFQAAGLLLIMLVFMVTPTLAQTEPPIGPDSGPTELADYWNWLWLGLQAAGTLIVGYLSKFIPGINQIGEKFYQVLAAALVLGLFLYLAFSSGATVWELINPVIGFITATGLLYPGVLKPMGLKSPQ